MKNELLIIKGLKIYLDNYKIKEDIIDEIFEFGTLNKDNGEKFNWIDACFLYQEENDDETIYKNVKTVFIDGVTIAPKNERVERIGFEFNIDHAHFNVDTIYSIRVVHTTGEYCEVMFNGMIDADDSYEKELYCKAWNSRPIQKTVLAQNAKKNIVNNLIRQPWNEKKIERIINIINE